MWARRWGQAVDDVLVNDEQLQRDADRDVVRRASTGPFIYVFVTLLFELAFDIWHKAPRLSRPLTVALVLVCIVRQIFLRPDRWERVMSRARWRKVFALTAVAMPALFGAYVAGCLYLFGYQQMTLLLLIGVTVLVNGGVYALAPRLWLARAFPILLLGPHIVLACFSDAAQIPSIPMFATYLAFGLYLARHLHDEYWQALRATAREKQRTEQLAEEMKSRLQVEADLRQAQKLESVGRLASGVAHEINTPVQFVTHSIQFLREASEEMLQLLDKQLEALTEEEVTDLEYLRDQIGPAFDRSSSHATSTSTSRISKPTTESCRR